MIDLHKNEVEWQKRWELAKIFEANPDNSKPKQKFFLTTPYPYMSGPLHIGHGRTYTIGDVYSRFQRMRGFNVLWPMAFHITGTPVLGVASRIAEGEIAARDLYRRYIRNYVTDDNKVERILESFADPWNVANFFAGVCKQDFGSLGYSIDWRRTFTTGDPEYNAFVSWQFWRLKDLGYIKQGNYPILYCPNDKNAVGEDDLLSGENAKVVEFTGILFPSEEGYFVASTLRPETIYGATNLWVNPDADYVKAEVDGKIWFISETAAEKMKLQAHEVEILEQIKGSDLVGRTCQLPIKGLKRDLPVLPAVFVAPEAATGVVYSVPAHAPYDYQGLIDLQQNPAEVQKFSLDDSIVQNIHPIAMISIKGYGEFPAKDICEQMNITSQSETEKLDKATETIYRDEYYQGNMMDNTGPFAGRLVREVKEDVLKVLQDSDRAEPIYELDQKSVVCRCNTPITVAVLDNQWFLDYGNPKWQKSARKTLDSMTIWPEKYRSYFEATFDWLHQRPCARRRGIGTHLPFDESGDWIIESLSDSTIYMAFYTVIHLIRKCKITKEQLINDLFDFIFLGIGDQDKIAKKTQIPPEVIGELSTEFNYWYPNDLRHTAISHISNHLSFFIYHHAALFPEKHQPRAITLNEHLVRDGKKMSKSKGNVIPLADIAKHYSADLARLFYVSSAELDGLVDWRASQLKGVQNKLKLIWSTVVEIMALPQVSIETFQGNLNYQSRWMLSRIESVILQATTNLTEYSFRSYVLTVAFTLVTEIRKYLEISKSLSTEERGSVLWYTLDKWARILAPIVPHLAEEIWNRMGHDYTTNDFVSLAAWPQPSAQYIDVQIERSQEVVENTIADIKEVLMLTTQGNTPVPSHIRIYTASRWKYTAFRYIHEKRIKFTIGDIMKEISTLPEMVPFKKKFAKLAQRIVKMSHLPVFATPEKELQALQKAIGQFKSEFKLTTEIISEDDVTFENDTLNKARHALPGKPAFFLYTPNQVVNRSSIHKTHP